jgi:hypothetical protein
MSAALSADDEESQNRQHTDSDEQRRMVGLVVFGKDALLAAVIVFQLGNFGRDAFQLDIELKQSA